MDRGFQYAGVPALAACAWMCISLLACSAPAVVDRDAPGDPPLDFYIEHLESRNALERGSSVRIVNRWGDIRARAGTGNEVVLDAAIQRIGKPFPDPPELAVVEGADYFDIEVRYPDASLDPRTGRVDIAVYLPTGLEVSLETRDGAIELKRTAVDFKARTVSGGVLFINQGSAEVESESGEIIARPIEPGWGVLKLSSTSGAVSAYLPAGRALEVIARGTDRVESDWPVLSNDGAYLIRFGEQGEERDRVQITSGGAVLVREVLSWPDPSADSFSGQRSGG